MATVEEVFGIADVLFVKPENLTTDVNDFLAQVKHAAHDRGIEDITVPSDGTPLIAV